MSDWASYRGIRNSEGEPNQGKPSRFGNTEASERSSQGSFRHYFPAQDRYERSYSILVVRPFGGRAREQRVSSVFERPPLAAACCDPRGVIIEMNRCFEQTLEPHLAKQPRLLLYALIPAEARYRTESLLNAWLASACGSIRIEGKRGIPDRLAVANWTAWRVSVRGEVTPMKFAQPLCKPRD
jgi:hypothetical protein